MIRHTSLTLALSLAACSSSSTTKPTAAQYDDTAQAVAASASSRKASGLRSAAAGDDDQGGDLATMSDTLMLSAGTLPLGISLSGDGHFEGSRLGLACNYAVTCKAASGATVTCGVAADQATVDVMWSGTLTSAAVTASVTRTGTWTVTGLHGATASISGDGEFSFNATLQSVFRPSASASFAFDASATYHAVQLSTSTHAAVGGSIDYEIHATEAATTASASSSVKFDVQAELTFHADSTATLVLDGDQRYTLNTETGVVVRASAN
jgi:hypothetical protein